MQLMSLAIPPAWAHGAHFHSLCLTLSRTVALRRLKPTCHPVCTAMLKKRQTSNRVSDNLVKALIPHYKCKSCTLRCTGEQVLEPAAIGTHALTATGGGSGRDPPPHPPDEAPSVWCAGAPPAPSALPSRPPAN